jgi:tetratricopeptide (TPR) repeat protein
MGEVWRARDTELGRGVAVKVLPEEVASEPRRVERFRREARALAALSHPNLLEVHDVGSSNGLDYVVTELLEGDSLRAAIPPSGLPWQKVVEIGAAVAEGLAAAHGKGIIHRDLKPENLFLTADGRVKILDFGLATIDDDLGVDGDSPTVTEDGAVLGTAGYMSPEQLRGQPATAQSDIFSLGCVMYEMASGMRAFSGNTGAELYAAILKEEPPQLSSSGATVPVDLERIVHRCLEKRPEARSQSAADLAHSLKSLGSSPSAPVMATPSAVASVGRHRHRPWTVPAVVVGVILAAITSWWALSERGTQEAAVEDTTTLDPNRIAVVPFTNRTGDASLDNLAALTADRLTQGLADLDEIEVAPASVVAASAAGVDSSQMAGVVATGTDSGLVLTGVWDSVGPGLELQATLEDAQRGSVIRAFDPIPATNEAPQEAIATLRDWTLMAVQDHLHPILAWGAGDRFPKYEAYQAYRRFFEAMETGPSESAAGHALQARQLDPEFARPLLHVGAAWIPGISSFELHDMMIDFFRPVHEMNLTPRQQLIVEMIDARMDGRWQEAYRLSMLELERDPSNSWARKDAIKNAIFTHRPLEVIELFEAMKEDSLTPGRYRYFTARWVLWALHFTGRHEEELILARRVLAEEFGETAGESARANELRALAALGRIDEIDAILTEVLLEPDSFLADSQEMSAVVYELRAHGFAEEAQDVAERSLSLYASGDDTTTLDRCDPCEAYVLMAAERFSEARTVFEKLLTDVPDNRDWCMQLGICAAVLGDRETALEMERRIEEIGPAMGPTDVPYGTRGAGEIMQASIAAQLGDHDRAIRLIQQGIAAGYGYNHWIHANPAFEPLWDHPEFQEILRPKG